MTVHQTVDKTVTIAAVETDAVGMAIHKVMQKLQNADGKIVVTALLETEAGVTMTITEVMETDAATAVLKDMALPTVATKAVAEAIQAAADTPAVVVLIPMTTEETDKVGLEIPKDIQKLQSVDGKTEVALPDAAVVTAAAVTDVMIVMMKKKTAVVTDVVAVMMMRMTTVAKDADGSETLKGMLKQQSVDGKTVTKMLSKNKSPEYRAICFLINNGYLRNILYINNV